MVSVLRLLPPQARAQQTYSFKGQTVHTVGCVRVLPRPNSAFVAGRRPRTTVTAWAWWCAEEASRGADTWTPPTSPRPPKWHPYCSLSLPWSSWAEQRRPDCPTLLYTLKRNTHSQNQASSRPRAAPGSWLAGLLPSQHPALSYCGSVSKSQPLPSRKKKTKNLGCKRLLNSMEWMPSL